MRGCSRGDLPCAFAGQLQRLPEHHVDPPLDLGRLERRPQSRVSGGVQAPEEPGEVDGQFSPPGCASGVPVGGNGAHLVGGSPGEEASALGGRIVSTRSEWHVVPVDIGAVSDPRAMMSLMPNTMQNFALTWTDAAGQRRASSVAYDEGSANGRKNDLEAAGAAGVTIVPIRPGQLPQP